MTVKVSAETAFVIRCNECGFNQQTRVEAEAQRLATEHEERHVASRAMGRQIAGQVFNTRGSDKPWFGVVNNAQEQAAAEGFPYFEWNGFIYTSIGCDMSKPVAWAKDVEGVA